MADDHRRNMDRRTFVRGAGALGAIGLTGGLGSLASACGGSSSPSISTGNPARGGRAVLASVDKPLNLDAHDIQGYGSLVVFQNIYSSLIYVDAKFQYGPGLAASWTQDDAKTWTFELVDNAVWHNDEPFTSKDVVYSFNRLKEHTVSTFAAPIDRAEALGKYKVRLHLNSPYGAVEPLLAGLISIMNEKAVKSSDPKREPIGTGPYRLAEWVQDDHVTLQKWDKHYKDDKPVLDEVVFRAVGEDSVRLTGLQTGELDWIQRVPAPRAEELKSSADVASSAGAPYFPSMLILNCKKPPFNDVRVRQAVAWAIDRQQLVDLVWHGTAVVATEATSEPSPWYTGVNPYEGGPDLDKARALLREAGISGRLEIDYSTRADVPFRVREAEVIQAQLRPLGIDLKVQRYDSAEWIERLVTQGYDMSGIQYSNTNDPAFFYGVVTRTGGPLNFPGYANKESDEVIDRFMLESDQATRMKVYPDLVRRIAEEAPVVFMANELQQYWTRPDFRGHTPLSTLEIRAEEMWRTS